MKTFVAALLIVTIYQVICLIVYELTKQNNKLLIWMVMFIPLSILYAIRPIVKKIILTYYHKHYNKYCVYYKDHSTFYIYTTSKIENTLYHEGENDWYVKRISTGNNIKSIPKKHNLYNGQEFFEGNDMKKLWKNTEK